MTPAEHNMLVTLINDAGLSDGKVIKADGMWHIIGATQPARVNVPPPIINLPTAQWGTEPAVVIEGRR